MNASQQARREQFMPSRRVRTAITRGADLTPYTANDVVGGLFTFPRISESSPLIRIDHALLSLDLSAVPGSMSTFRLHLYSCEPSALADNDAFTMSAADFAKYVGYIDIGTPVDVGPILVVQAADIRRVCQSLLGDLYGYLVTAGAYTPAASTTITLDLAGTEV